MHRFNELFHCFFGSNVQPFPSQSEQSRVLIPSTQTPTSTSPPASHSNTLDYPELLHWQDALSVYTPSLTPKVKQSPLYPTLTPTPHLPASNTTVPICSPYSPAYPYYSPFSPDTCSQSYKQPSAPPAYPVDPQYSIFSPSTSKYNYKEKSILLICPTNFQDFPSRPTLDPTADLYERMFVAMGFEVTKLVGNVSKDNITEAVTAMKTAKERRKRDLTSETIKQRAVIGIVLVTHFVQVQGDVLMYLSNTTRDQYYIKHALKLEEVTRLLVLLIGAYDDAFVICDGCFVVDLQETLSRSLNERFASTSPCGIYERKAYDAIQFTLKDEWERKKVISISASSRNKTAFMHPQIGSYLVASLAQGLCEITLSTANDFCCAEWFRYSAKICQRRYSCDGRIQAPVVNSLLNQYCSSNLYLMPDYNSIMEFSVYLATNYPMLSDPILTQKLDTCDTIGSTSKNNRKRGRRSQLTPKNLFGEEELNNRQAEKYTQLDNLSGVADSAVPLKSPSSHYGVMERNAFTNRTIDSMDEDYTEADMDIE